MKILYLSIRVLSFLYPETTSLIPRFYYYPISAIRKTSLGSRFNCKAFLFSFKILFGLLRIRIPKTDRVHIAGRMKRQTGSIYELQHIEKGVFK